MCRLVRSLQQHHRDPLWQRPLRFACFLSVLISVAACQKADEPESVPSVPPDTSVIVQQSSMNSQAARDWPQARFATPGRIAVFEQRAGDAQAGRRALLEEAYISCGLPERVFRQLLGDATPLQIPGRNRAADGLPFSVNVVQGQSGESVVSNNCLTCHGAPLFGELVVGLGNEFLDFTIDASVLAERAGALVNGTTETDEWQRYADRIAAIAPHIRTHTVGVNPANNLTFVLIAHRHAQSNAWSSEALLPLPPTDPAPVSVPPWWRMSKKPAMFNLGEGRLDHARLMMSASMLCTDTIDELEQIDTYAPDIRAFIASLEPPPWPFAVDDSLAATGQGVFEMHCSSCHGTYGDDAHYPARLVPLETVQTDATLVEFAHGDGAAYIDWFNRSYYGKRSTAAPGPGYVAPPLDGVWATAPFLHNGSVPSIRALLDSSQRPTYWRHTVRDTADPAGYDQKNLGWLFDSLPSGKQGQPEPERIYDTTLPGYASSGHLFGDDLSDQQRTAVIEYLKTL